MRRIRLVLDGSPQVGLTDIMTDAPPVVWGANAVKFQTFLSDLSDRESPFDADEIDSITLEFRENEESVNMLVSAAEPDDPAAECTFAEFEDDEGQHYEFTVPTSIMSAVTTAGRFWMAVKAVTDDDETITFGAGYVRVTETTAGGTAPTLVLTSATLNDDGTLTLSASGITFKVTPLDVEASSYTGSTLLLESTEPDDDGMLTVSALGISFRVPATDLET